MTPIDTTTWAVVAPSTVGKRTASWVRDEHGVWWLRKFPRPRAGAEEGAEPFAEAIAAKLATDAGLKAPEVHVCLHRGALGIISKKFHGPDEDFTHGSELMQRLDPGYDPDDHSVHTLTTALGALDEVSKGTLRSEFVRMLAFDAWAGNSDRHQENWGVIAANTNAPRLAPAYDMAACFGSALTDGTIEGHLADSTRLERFVRNCPSGFGDGTKLVKMAALVQELRPLPEWSSNFRKWSPHFDHAARAARSYVDPIPTTLLSTARKRFTLEMLCRRLKWLEGTSP